MALRAVLFDYGMVLSVQPPAEAHAALLRLSGLSEEKLDSLYWANRPAYDLGTLTGEGFWRKLAQDAAISLPPSTIDELVAWDCRMWMDENSAMIAWQLALKKRGLLTGILSNMGDAVLAAMKRKFDWLDRFDLLVWSYQLHLAKPDPAIFRYALGKLNVAPAETLFIDDRTDNVDAARALGIQSLVFSGIEQLRADLVAHDLSKELPLP